MEIMNEEYPSYELLQPWSSFVLKTKLPDKILKEMVELTDKIVFDSSSEDFGPNLVGQIEWEPKIELKLIKKTNIEKYLYDMIHQYCMRAHLQNYPTSRMNSAIPPPLSKYLIDPMWIVSQKDNEYNPIHVHGQCTLSAVLYLKIPEYLPSRKQTKGEYNNFNTDGSIVFSNSPRNPMGVFGTEGVLTINPQPGDFFIFPAEQYHMVYPFRTADGKGERRSVSFNVICNSDSKDLNKEKDKKIKKY